MSEDQQDDADWGSGPSDEEWQALLAASKLDPAKRAASREAILSHENAIDCTIFRITPDDEVIEICDGKILFIGKHQVIEGLDEEEYEELYGELDVDLLVDAWVEYLPAAEQLASEPEPPDMVSVEPGLGIALPYQLIDYVETIEGRRCILLNCIDSEDIVGG